MHTFQFIDNLGFVQDTVFCLDLAEAMEYAIKYELMDCEIVDIGPTSLYAWAEVLAA